MGYGQVDSAWRDAAIDYVDGKGDERLRDLVARFRERTARDEVVHTLKWDVRDAINERYAALLGERIATGIVTKEVLVRMPDDIRRIDHRGGDAEEQARARTWRQAHIKYQRGYNDWLRVEDACMGGFSRFDSCGLAAKYRHAGADGAKWALTSEQGLCERHSKKVMAERAINEVRERDDFKERAAALGIDVPYFWADKVVKANA